MAYDTVTLNVINEKTNSKREFTVLTENKKFINSVVTVKEDNTITEDQLKQLQNAALRRGDASVLEMCDLSPEETINLAKLNGYSKYYDIKLSKDRKYYNVTIKKCGLTNAPTLGTIKSDFGVADGVFVQKGNIPHGNANLIDRSKKGYTPDGRNIDYDRVQIAAGETINIPVAEVTLKKSPKNSFCRFFQ